ncbi:hypothetical protein MMC13_008189 [Lambiella insularis]|nr:hypothetical protein [Lambiella insularis]
MLVAAVATVIRTPLLLVVAGGLNQSAWNWLAEKETSGDSSRQALEDLEIFSEAAANSRNSIRLLIRTRGRYIASFGALITVLSLAFDAFVQQVLTTETQSQGIFLSGPNFTTGNILPIRPIAIYYVNRPIGISSIPASLGEVSITLPDVGKEGHTEEVWRLDFAIPGTNKSELFITRATIATLSSLGVPTDYYANSTSVGNPVFAYDCSFCFCVQGYSATAFFGKVSQQRVPTTDEQMYAHWEDEGLSVTRAPNVVPAELNAPDPAIFNVSGEGLSNLGIQLSAILTGNAITGLHHTRSQHLMPRAGLHQASSLQSSGAPAAALSPTLLRSYSASQTA